MINTLNYEIQRIKEIYSLLFPDKFVLVLLEKVSPQAIVEAKEFSVARANDFISLGNSEVIPIKIGNSANQVPEKVFRLCYSEESLENYSPPQPKIPQTVKQRILHWLREKLMYLSPIVYEHIKHLYFTTLEKNKPSLQILPIFKDITKPKFTAKPHKNLLFLMHWLEVSGAEKFAVDCCKLAANNGCKVFVAVSYLSRPFYKKQLIHFAKVYELARQIPQQYRLSFLTKLIAKNKISLIHNHHSPDFYSSLPMIRCYFPSIVTVDTLHIKEKDRVGGGFPTTSLRWSNYIHYHHVISQNLVQYFVDNGIDPARVVLGYIVKKSVNPQTFSLPKSLGQKKINIVFIARMTTQKRPLLAIVLIFWAIKFAFKHKIQVKADMVGDGFYLNTLKRKVTHSKYRTAIIFHESNANTRQILREADILLITSENEGITLVGYEAYEAGTLVVSTDVGAQKELVPEELLLPEKPIAAYQKWKTLFKKLILEETFAERCIESFQAKVKKISSFKSAEEVLKEIYGI